MGTPGAKEILTAEREFKAFKGFEVVVTPDTIPGMKVGWVGLGWSWGGEEAPPNAADAADVANAANAANVTNATTGA